MLKYMFNSFEVIVGCGLSILGGLIYFDLERKIEQGLNMVDPTSALVVAKTFALVNNLGEAQTYSMGLIVIGIFLTADGLARLRLSQ
jgi:hypothetical protein